MVFLLLVPVCVQNQNDRQLATKEDTWIRLAEQRLYRMLVPLYAFTTGEGDKSLLEHCMLGEIPLFSYVAQQEVGRGKAYPGAYDRKLPEGEQAYEKSLEEQDLTKEQLDAFLRENEKYAKTSPDALSGEGFQNREGEAALQEPDETGQERSLEERVQEAAGVGERQRLYPLEQYQDEEQLLKEFYAVDPTTSVEGVPLQLDALLSKDMKISKEGETPQILIYHTHSQEAFADSVLGAEPMSIVGVGDYLTALLQEKYGFRVLHHKEAYDVEKRDYAYAKAAPALEKLLAENPSIQVVIDLHRDEMAEETRLVTQLNGKPTARFMFFNGLSRTKKTGEIASLHNPYLAENLAFAFQMQLACNEYYPGLTRRIYLKGYRYNMHYCPKTLLVELGAQNNTVEEAYNACEPLAAMLNVVLSGEETHIP